MLIVHHEVSLLPVFKIDEMLIISLSRINAIPIVRAVQGDE